LDEAFEATHRLGAYLRIVPTEELLGEGAAMEAIEEWVKLGVFASCSKGISMLQTTRWHRFRGERSGAPSAVFLVTVGGAMQEPESAPMLGAVPFGLQRLHHRECSGYIDLRTPIRDH